MKKSKRTIKTTKKLKNKFFIQKNYSLIIFVLLFASVGIFLLLKIFANPTPLYIPTFPKSASTCSELNQIASVSANKVEVSSISANSIGSAVQNAKPGSFIIVRGSSTIKNYPLQIIQNKLSDSDITILPAEGELLTVEGFNITKSTNIKIACFKNIGHIHTKLSSFISVVSNTFPAGGKTTDFCKSTNRARIAFCEGSNNSILQGNLIIGGTRLVSLYGSSVIGGSNTIKKITIDGNQFDGNGREGNAVNGTDDAIQVFNASELYISRNKFSNLATSMGCQDYNKNGTIADDPCHNDGIQIMASTDIVIRNNEFSWPEGDGTGDQAILVQSKSGRTYIANNLCYNWVGSCLTIAEVSEVNIVNNTLIAHGNRQGIFLENSPSPRNVYIWNNILSKIQLNSGSPRPTFESHNIVATNSGGNLTGADPAQNLIIKSDLLTLFISTDPLSLDRFSLKRESVATDSGLYRTLTPDYDFTLNNRDSIPDRGSRESISVVDNTAPTTPTGVKVIQVNNSNSAKVTWEASTDNVAVSRYSVFRIDPGSTNGKLIGTVSGLQYTNSGLVRGKNYRFYVKAHDSAGNISPATPSVSIYIK